MTARRSRVPARRARRAAWAGLVVVLVACSTATPPPSPQAAPPQTAPQTAPPSLPPTAAAPTFTAGACPMALPPTNVRVTCGQVAVPEQRGRESTTIHLAVARLSTGDHPGAAPLLYLEGGPGGSALAEVDLWIAPESPLLHDRDVILVDQRGTGYSSPRLTCDPEYDDPASDDLNDDELTERCHERLTASGISLDAYDTVESANDVEDLRRALDIDRWNILGVSYGTRLALEVLRRHPAGVRAVVLDSVDPPGVKVLDEQPANLWAAITAVLGDCRADDACNRAFPDLEQRLVDTVSRLDAHPVAIRRTWDDGSGRPHDEDVDMSGGELVRSIFDALYLTAVIPDVPKAIDAAARGDLQRADDLLGGLDAPDTAPASGADPPTGSAADPPSDTDGLFLTITCAEDAPDSSRASVEQASAQVPAPIRRALVADVVDQLTSCAHWSVSPRHLEPVRSDVPALLLAGADDPITPPRWAQTAAQTLPRSQVVVVPGVGHGVIDAGACAVGTITAFLAAPDGDPRPPCDDHPPFRTS